MRTLPPPGSDPGSIADFVDSLVRESELDERRECWLQEAERGLNLYMGNHWLTRDKGELIRVVLNRIQNCIISLMAIQAGDPPRITFSPRETGDPPIHYINTQLPEAQGFIDTWGTVGFPIDLEQPLPENLADELRAQIDMSEFQAAQMVALGQPKPKTLPRDLLIDVDDSTTAQALQTIFDARWEESDCQFVFVDNTLNRNVLGWQPTLIEFDPVSRLDVLTNVHGMHVYPDPLNTDSTRWQYAVYDQPVSADEAKSKYPEASAAIDEAKQQGMIQFPGSASRNRAAMYDQRFERDMVVIRTCWIRFQPYPLSTQDAVDSGQVEQRDVPTGPPQYQLNDAGEPVCPECGQSSESFLAQTPFLHCWQCGAEMGNTPSQPGLFKPGTDTETDPSDAEWPMHQSIRQITTVGRFVIFDGECPWPSIPLPSNRNVPIPYSPYGQGEPKRLEGLQMAINRVLSAMVTHQAYNAFPPELVPDSVVERLDKQLRNARTKPGQRITIPEELITQLNGIKNVVGTMEVPAMPADFWKLLDLLISLIDKEANQSDVTQGNASATWSGETVKALQNAASQIIRGKAIFTEFYLKNVAKLMVHSIVNFLNVTDWQRYVSKYPVQALEALHSRAKSIDIDVKVEISSGSGAAKASELTNLVAAKQIGVPVSTPTILERLNLDPEAEQQREADFQQRQMILNGPPAPAVGPAANNGATGPGSSGPAQPQQAAA